MLRTRFSCAVLFLLAFAMAMPVWAQDAKTVYTQVALWDVPRDKWAAFVDQITKYEKPVMEKLVAEGLIIEWGFDANGLHAPDEYSHSTWTSAYSLAALEKSQAAYYEALGDKADMLEADLAGMLIKHRDEVTYSDHNGFRSSNLNGGYAVGNFSQIKPGKGGEFNNAFVAWQKPIYEKLLAEGTIVSYALTLENFHTHTPGGAWAWYVTDTAENMDKAEAAFEAAWTALSGMERAARTDQRNDIMDWKAHRDGFTRIIHYVSK